MGDVGRVRATLGDAMEHLDPLLDSRPRLGRPQRRPRPCHSVRLGFLSLTELDVVDSGAASESDLRVSVV